MYVCTNAQGGLVHVHNFFLAANDLKLELECGAGYCCHKLKILNMGLHLNKQKTCREKIYRKKLIFNDLEYPQYLKLG